MSHKHDLPHRSTGEGKSERSLSVKTYEMLGALTIVALLLVAGNASAAIVSVSFDENGNGSWDGGLLTSGFNTPQEGGGHATLYYDLSPLATGAENGVVSGDVVITEPDGLTSDILRFIDDGSFVYVYSDNSDSDPCGSDLADTGIPTVWSPVVYMDEVGAEGGWTGITYTPTSGQPGYLYWDDDPSKTVTYYFTSDVPEPATLSLLALGGLAVLIRRRK
jgi:hypothetical protein